MGRIKQPFVREEGKKDARLIIIATEGRKTERIYFEALAQEYDTPAVHIEIIKRENDNSSPEQVMQSLNEFAVKYELDENDELWMVIDRDYQSWEPKSIKQVAQLCHQKKGFNLALSNPAFEIWLLLHVKDINEYSEPDKKKLFENKKVTAKKTALKKELSKILIGFDETSYNPEKFIPYVETAIARAKALDTNPKARWQDYLGTRVYKLAVKTISKK
jgi:hypothetical protein